MLTFPLAIPKFLLFLNEFLLVSLIPFGYNHISEFLSVVYFRLFPIENMFVIVVWVIVVRFFLRLILIGVSLFGMKVKLLSFSWLEF